MADSNRPRATPTLGRPTRRCSQAQRLHHRNRGSSSQPSSNAPAAHPIPKELHSKSSNQPLSIPLSKYAIRTTHRPDNPCHHPNKRPCPGRCGQNLSFPLAPGLVSFGCVIVYGSNQPAFTALRACARDRGRKNANSLAHPTCSLLENAFPTPVHRDSRRPKTPTATLLPEPGAPRSSSPSNLGPNPARRAGANENPHGMVNEHAWSLSPRSGRAELSSSAAENHVG